MFTDSAWCPDTTYVILAQSCRRYANETCSYTCRTGYKPKDSSKLNTVTCTNYATWDKRLSTLCEKIKCPIIIPNGNISKICSREYKIICDRYYCNSGFLHPSGRTELICNSSGQWEWFHDLNRDFCLNEADLCPSVIKNGTISVSCDRYEGDTCAFSCDSGCKEISRYATVVCRYGTWDPAADSLCTDCVQCKGDIPHGYIDIDNCYAGKTCSYDCNNNLQYVKNENISAVICSNTTNRWEPSTSSTDFTTENDLCLARSCNTRIPNGHLPSSCSANVGSVCRYVCNVGYHRNFPNVYCRSSNRWSFLTDRYPWITDIITFWSVDKQKLCTNSQQCPLEDIPNGKLDADCERNPGDICPYTCDDGYRAMHYSSDQTNIKCTSFSTWSIAVSLLCERIVCPSRILNGYVSCLNKNYKAQCSSYTCNSGYLRSLHSSLTCNYEGQWEWTIPSTSKFCLGEDDLCPSYIPNGSLSFGCNRREGDMCRYDCTGCRNDTSPDWLTCRNKTWDSETDYLCTNCPVRCPLYLPEGKVYDSCNRAPNNTCGVTCNEECVKQLMSLRCSSYGEWINASSACSCTYCPHFIPNGHISNWSSYDGVPCDFKPGSFCSTICNDGCTVQYSSALCRRSGQWRFADSLCDCKDSTESNKDNSDGGGSNTVVIVMSVLGIIVFIIIVAGVLIACNRRHSHRTTQNNNPLTQSEFQPSVYHIPSRTNNNQDTIALATSAQRTNANVPTNWNQSSPTNMFSMQEPPPYNELSFTKTDETAPPPSYEDVISQSLERTQQTFLN